MIQVLNHRKDILKGFRKTIVERYMLNFKYNHSYFMN